MTFPAVICRALDFATFSVNVSEMAEKANPIDPLSDVGDPTKKGLKRKDDVPPLNPASPPKQGKQNETYVFVIS